MADMNKLVEELSALTVLEAAELVKKLEEKWGVSAAAAVAVAAAPAAAAAAEPVEEKTEFNVVIKSGGDKKLQVIKVVRAARADLGLKEAKALVDEAPKTLLEAVPKADADKWKKELEDAGATVEIQ